MTTEPPTIATAPRRRPMRLALGFGSFGLIWGGSAVLAWHEWSGDARWWASNAPLADRRLVASDRAHLLYEAVGWSVVVAILAAGVLFAGTRRGLGWASRLAGGIACVGIAAWILVALVSFKGRDGPQPINCDSLRNVGEGSGWIEHGWSWSEFGMVVVVTPARGETRRVICG